MTDTRAARKELLRRRRDQHRSPSGHPTAAEWAAESRRVGTQLPPSGQLGVPERRMWRIHQLDPDSVSHNITLALTVAGTSAERLIAGIESVVARAEVLGSVIIVDDETPRRAGVEIGGRWAEPGRVWVLGGEPLGAGCSPAQTASALARTPFDLTREAPVRARVFPADADHQVAVVLSFHHLAVDDTSWPLLLGSILTGEWRVDMAGGDSPVRRHSTGEQDRATSDDVRTALAVEHARATWAAGGVRFPFSGELPATTAEQSWLAPLHEAPGRQLRRDLDSVDLAAFTSFASIVGGTGNAALVVLIALTVTAVTGAADHVLLVPADNRQPGQRPDRVGYCGNIIPIRFTFDPAATVGQTMRAGLAATYAAMSYADVDFGSILTALRNSGGRFPVVEVLGSVRSAPTRGIPVADGMSVEYRSVSAGIVPYPLMLAVELAGATRAHLEVDYQTATGEVLAEHAAAIVATLLRRIPAAPDDPLAIVLAQAKATAAGAQ
ncbi:hypothetical protein GCM10010528_16640 [Gordonia defluvii]|uniref:Condensation domain-containing protein n=1 Tax=Gordonia defluvii TaxID=283718 RepID=A0ABP6L9C9_9ACTN|nr:condensation domain-containing protein [Gordonia sp. UBA5067]